MTAEDILGHMVTQLSVTECVQRICGWLETDENIHKLFICANPHSLVLADKDPIFHQSIQSADLLTPDGTGVILASKVLGGTIRKRVTGSDIFQALSEKLNAIGGKSYFFLGSTDETLEKIRLKIAKEYPQIHFAGSYSPPFKEELNEEESRIMINAINTAQPDILWLGMSAPKQEKWAFRYKDELDVKFIGAIGAVFDFYVGNIRRSSPLFQKLGLEWLPRLVQEPRRLFKRNFVSSPLFLWMLFRQYVKRIDK